jgi:hypothetical protein
LNGARAGFYIIYSLLAHNSPPHTHTLSSLNNNPWIKLTPKDQEEEGKKEGEGS